jgi:phytoene dehydrogenase-like protein
MNQSAQAAGETVIIGAGIGGLAAGHFLKKAGMECRIFERERVPGGRIQALRKADAVDFCGHSTLETVVRSARRRGAFFNSLRGVPIR